MLGGYDVAGKGIYFMKKFTNLPLFKRVTLKFEAIAVDSWDNEYYIVDANGE